MSTPPQPHRTTTPDDAMDAPALQAVRAGEGLVDPDSKLGQYVQGEAPTEASTETPWATPDGGVLRDAPFGQTPFGGETPFFTGGGTTPAFEADDTQGIPTGLPDLLDLPPLADTPVGPDWQSKDRLPAESTLDPLIEAVAAVPAPVQPVTAAHVAELPQRISRDEVDSPPPRQAFMLGLVMASVAWFLVIIGWMAITFR